MRTRTVLIAATVAALAGAALGLVLERPSLVANSELGQRALQQVLAAGAPEAPAGVQVAVRGRPLPSVPALALDGTAVDLREAFAGRPTLVNVWATWCGPCIKEMPELQAYAQAQGEAGVRVAGVALDEADAVRAFIAQHAITYPQWHDSPGAADAGVRLGNPRGVLPFTVLVDADGTARAMRVGPFASVAEIRDWVDAALAR